MATPTWQDIGTYMSITGASESLALQKLQEHDGNLLQAVDSFYRGEEALMLGETNLPPPPPPNVYTEEPQRNFVHSSNNERQSVRGLSPILSAARSFKPSLLLDPNYRRDLFSKITAVGSSLLSPQGQASSGPAQPNNGVVPPVHLEHMPAVANEHNSAGYNASNIDNHMVEDEILQSVIRNSMLDVEAVPNAGNPERQFHQEEDDLARALAFSLETAEKEEALREQETRIRKPALVTDRRSEPGSSSSQNESQIEEEEQQLRGKSSYVATDHLHTNEEEASHLREWGVASAEELNEALMLENAILGMNSGGPSNNSASTFPLKTDPQPILRPLSPPLRQERRLLKEQQDKECQASLLLDKKKQENYHRKMLDEADQERSLAGKKPHLPSEPASDDENAVSLLFRRPNGSRFGRRFLKSDKLQILYDFVDMDIGGEVKPGTYRVVRPYPRRIFNLNESSLTLSEVGLTNKQEVLCLELI